MSTVNRRYSIFIKEMIKGSDQNTAYRKAYPQSTKENARVRSYKLLQNETIRNAVEKGRKEIEDAEFAALKAAKIEAAKKQIADETELDAKLSSIAMGQFRRKRKVPVYNKLTKVFEVVSVEEEPSEADIIAASDKLYKRKGAYAPVRSDVTSGGEKIKSHTPVDLLAVPVEILLELAKHINDTGVKG